MIKATKEVFNKIESRSGKIAALCITIPVIATSIYWIVKKMILLGAGIAILINIAELEKEIRANMTMISNVQGVSLDALKAEMESKTIYGVEVQKTNGGDLWYFKDEVIYTDRAGNKQIIKVVYSAHVRHKPKKIGYFDFNNKHYWIDPKKHEY